MVVLITGAAGFIGSRLALRLIAQDEAPQSDRLVLLDNFDPYYDPAVKRQNIEAIFRAAGKHGRADAITMIEGDLRDQALINRIFSEHAITRVAHLGALSNVRYSVDRGVQYSEVNTTGTVNLMDAVCKSAAGKSEVETFVFASTSSVYGNTQRIPFVEDEQPDFPLAPYPASKRAAELFAHSYHHLFGLNVTTLRLFNCYGPHGRPDMMPMKTIKAILNDEPITVWDGGRLERDWTYIDDAVDGIVAALYRPMGYQIINLGNGRPVTLTAFIQIYEDLIGKKAILREEKAPLTEPRITYCDNTRARQLLNFNPAIDLREGLRRTWEWYRERYLIGG